MSKLKKLVLTTAALTALAIGGAAFANAQNTGVAAQVPTTQGVSDVLTPGDTPDAAQPGDQSADGEHEDGDLAGASHDAETND